MNSLFNYELDENQIRHTLHDAELEYNSGAWSEFDSKFPANASKTHKNSFSKLPKINLNINRNVLVPVFFIIGLGGVSAIMFKFVDFKANEPRQVEKALVPEPANYKIEKKTVPILVKKEIPKPAAIAVKKDSVAVPSNTTTNLAITQPSVSGNTVTVAQAVGAEPNQGNNNLSDTGTPVKPALLQSAVQINQSPGNKRKRRRVEAEQLDAIKAPPLLNQESSGTEAEPELKIKTRDNPPD